MKKILFLALAIGLLVFNSFAQENNDLEEVEDIRLDIQVINLLNSLDLRKEQVISLLEKAKEVEIIRTRMRDTISSYKAELLEAFIPIKEDVEAGKVVIEKEQARKFREVKDKIEEISKNAQKEVENIAKAVEGGLEEFQLSALDGYKPCIIPIMNMTKGRIGQADPALGIVKVLERVKAAPDLKYSEDKEIFINRLIETVEKKIHPVSIPGVEKFDAAKAKVEISAVFEKIRNMDSVDFQLKKTALAEELGGKIIPDLPPLPRVDKIKKFLLSKNVIAILERRIK